MHFKVIQVFLRAFKDVPVRHALSVLVQVTCMHPGWAQSNGLDGLFELYPAYKGFLKNFRTPEQGADTMVHCREARGRSRQESRFATS